MTGSKHVGAVAIRGDGPPLVLVPGMQGRWEWLTPTVEPLARRFRVASYSLCGEPGAIAVHYAAAHPERVRALVLASAPGRARPELRNVFPSWTERLRFSLGMLRHVLCAPTSSTRAAQRIRLALADDVAATARRVSVPPLLVTGDDDLDRLVPPESTRQYRTCIARTEVAHLEGTGHMGVITRAALFASLVGRFVLAGEPDRAIIGEGPA